MTAIRRAPDPFEELLNPFIDVPLFGIPCGYCGQPAAGMVVATGGAVVAHVQRRLLPCPKYPHTPETP